MIIQYNIVVTIINVLNNSTSKFNKVFDFEITQTTDALLYNNYHVLSKGVYVLDMFNDEIDAYCNAQGIDKSSIEIDEFEIVSLTDRVDVFFEAEEDDTSLSLKPIIKCYVYPKNNALKVPNLIGAAYDSTTIIWSWPDDEQYAHYLVEEAIDPNSEADKSKIIAQLPIGATSYTETGLEPNTPYTRRLINYTDEQTSVVSPSVTVITDTVEASQSLEEYTVPKNYDFITKDSEREIIEENLEAFQSGIGDGNDLKVYKQMDADFYQKFKSYFKLTGRRIQKEKRYDQVGFNYKICMEAEEIVEEQEGEVTFDIDVYPREEITTKQYMYSTMPVDVYSKLYATIFLRKETTKTEPVEITTLQEVWGEAPVVLQYYGDPINIIFVIDKTNSLHALPGIGDGEPVMKKSICSCIDKIEKDKKDNTVRYCIIEFAQYANQVTDFVSAEEAKEAINNIKVDGSATSWAAGINAASKAISNSGVDGKFVTYLFSDGFPNTASDGEIHTAKQPGYTLPTVNGTKALHGVVESVLKDDLKYCADILKEKCEKIACLISNYGGGDYIDKSTSALVGYRKSYIDACHAIVPIDEKGILLWSNAKSMELVFQEYISAFSRLAPSEPVFEGYEPSVAVIEQPYSIDEVKAVQIETDLLKFTFDETITPVYYDQKEQRAIIDPTGIIPKHTQKVSDKNVYDLLLDAATKTPEWASGYNKPVGTTDGSFLIKGLFIKDTYAYADEDIMTDNTFDKSDLEDGTVGSVNVYTDIDTAGTTTYGDDCYLVSKDNYVYIDGYTDAIIYDGTNFLTTELNAYSRPSEILLSSTMKYNNIMSNRKNNNFQYTGETKDITAVLRLIEKGDDIWLEGYNGLSKVGDEIVIDGIKKDLIAHNDATYESPILNYRFNLEDPDAKVSLYEILPTCNPDSNYLHIVILHVYYANNIFITNEDNYVEQFGEDPIATTNSDYIPLEENLYQWTLMEWKDKKDNGWYIDNYLWFMGKPTLKQRSYYDELPGANMDDFYGQVNGRYSANNETGKKDLVVDTPQFNIPTTVIKDTIKIYAVITEFYPNTALVSYRWEHPTNEKDSITQVNGDYIIFSSDNIVKKDVEYLDMISTISIENQEIFDNKITDFMYEISKPETLHEYQNYYLEVTTDNSDVLAMRYPTEITFDENGIANIGVAYKGVVNATSQWAPRIHSGYFYLNQHEHFAYSEFDVKANFDTYEETNYKSTNGYVSFDVQLRHKAKPVEEYSIIKNTRSELIQNEEQYQWIDDKGLTLKPYINTNHYKEYLTYMYQSPVILFNNVLTEAGPLNVEYSFDDGSDLLSMEVRSYFIDEGRWSEWTSFTNNTVPQVPLSCAYQIRCALQATVQNIDLTLEDYMCCYLDWKDDIDETHTTNIVTVTDFMTTGPEEGEGIFISNILDYGCESQLTLDIFESNYNKNIQIYIAYSSTNKESLALENIKWYSFTNAKDSYCKGRYFRYKIVIPEGEKLYWLHKKALTLQSNEILPYINSISMTGTYAPTDIITNFVKTESFEIPKDGKYHTIFNRVLNIIGADVTDRGYTANEIEYITIQCITPNITIDYDKKIEDRYPYDYLNTEIEAKSDIDFDIVVKNTPYIFVERDEKDEFDVIVITGTPQQFCPITVEDTEGNVYTQLHNSNSFIQTETYLLTEETKYIELKSNRYDTDFHVYIDDEELDISEYKVINHLVIFNDFIGIGHTIKIEYCILYSFIADIDRINNTTTIYLHPSLDIPVPEKCKVYFETSTKNNKFIAQDLSLNPIYRTDYKGFIYLSDEHNEPHNVLIYCNPCRLKAGGYDKVDVSIEVLDIKGNPVIAKEVTIDCKYGILVCDNYETDMNGVVHLVYESAYLKCIDALTARVLTDDGTVVEQSITIINE